MTYFEQVQLTAVINELYERNSHLNS